MSIFRRILPFAFLALASAAWSQAQKPIEKPDEVEKGFSSLETFQGTFNTDSSLLKADTRVGYDFNQHFGLFVGVPIYFVNSNVVAPATPAATTTATNTGGMGNSYFGLVFRVPGKSINYTSTATFSAPTGNVNDGFSSGRGNADWDNYLDHSFNKFTPFLDAGLSNTVPDSSLFTRPFTSLGVVTHFEEGGEYELIDHFSAGASGYEVVPFGTQKLFSKVVGKGQNGKGSGNPNRTFDGAPETVGTDITRENGFNTWVAFQPSGLWRLEIGYSRSATFDLNSFGFNLGLNIGKMLKARRGM